MMPTDKPKSAGAQAAAPTKPKREGAVAFQLPGETEGAAVARTMLSTEVDAAFTADNWIFPPGADAGPIGEKVVLMDLVKELQGRVKAVNVGDLSKAEAVLVSQAQTLDMVFNNLMRRCAETQALQLWECRMRVALRAQNQCRMTLETLAEIKNPRPVAFVKQANISTGHQQVNNGVAANGPAKPARAGDNQFTQTELLTEGAPNELDTGTTGTAGRADPLMAPVGEGDRTEDRGGKGSRREERLEGRDAAGAAGSGKSAARTTRDAEGGRRRVTR